VRVEDIRNKKQKYMEDLKLKNCNNYIKELILLKTKYIEEATKILL
jgi:hypothetical protein